jgi:hypothetical protein
MAGIGGTLDGGRELSDVEQKQPLLGRLLGRIIDGVNQTAQNAAVSPTGENASPSPLASVNVSAAASGELLHVTLNHPGQVQRNVRYFVEIHTSSTFGAPVIVHDAGSSRTLAPFHLPTFSGDGSTTHKYYVRAYAQNPGGQPTPIYTVGGEGNATAFTMTGTTKMDFAPAQGSGTGPNTGQGGYGLGKVQQRF